MRVVVCLLIAFCLGSVSALFDCARETGACKNGGTCNMAAGTCSCDALYTGYDCSVVIADQSHADCTPTNPCMNGGTCHKSATAGAVSCLCTPDYSGATCTDKRYTVTCDTAANPNTMLMKVIPHVASFTGKVYLKDKEGTCDFTQTGTGTGIYETAALAVNDASCGATSSGTNNVQEAIIQFSTDTLTTRDELITFTCGTSDVVAQTSGAVTIQNVESNLGTKSVSNVPLDADVDLTLTSGGNSASGATLDLGADIVLTAFLTTEGMAKFKAVRLTRCYAANAATSGSAYKSKDFITASCPSPDLKSVMLTAVTGTATSKTFTFDAFKFTGSTDIYVTCDIKPCTVATDCQELPCGTARRKREAGTSQEKVLQRSFNINDPLALATAAATLNEFKEENACYLTWEMTATVVALSVALLLLLILCIVLVVKAILNRRTDTTVCRDDTSDTTSTAHLPHLPTLVSNKC